MKKVVLTVLLFIGTTCNAQLGVQTLGPNDLPFYGQWYTIDHKNYKDQVLYFDTEEKVDSLLLVLLAPWELQLSDAEKGEKGDLYWVVDNYNGFYATVYKIYIDDKDAIINIITVFND